MGYKLSYDRFNELLSELKEEYRIFAPKRLQGIGRFSDQDSIRYEEVYKAEDIVWDVKSHFSPKEILFPINQPLFYFKDGEYIESPVDEKGLIIFLRPCDLNSVTVLDNIFLKNVGVCDVYYERLRNKAIFFMIECTESFESCFCVSMNTNSTDRYDVALRFNNNQELVCSVKNEKFENVFSKDAETVEFKPGFVTRNLIKVTIPETDKITPEIFEHELWNEYSERCIACGRCNFVCPTCCCWTMRNLKYAENNSMGEQRRVWAGCHSNGFTDMAGGHGFRKNYGDRMRFKTMHKIYDYKKRYGTHMCVGCGRCDDICPEYISFSNCINKLNKIIKEGDTK